MRRQGGPKARAEATRSNPVAAAPSLVPADTAVASTSEPEPADPDPVSEASPTPIEAPDPPIIQSPSGRVYIVWKGTSTVCDCSVCQGAGDTSVIGIHTSTHHHTVAWDNLNRLLGGYSYFKGHRLRKCEPAKAFDAYQQEANRHGSPSIPTLHIWDV